MFTERPSEQDAAAFLCGFVLTSLEISEPLTHARTSDPAEVVILGTFLRARDLAAGVVSEIQAGRGRNAMPLARHLFEEYLVACYIIDDPDPRQDQYHAFDADSRLEMARKGGLLDAMPTEQRRTYEVLAAAAKAKQEAAKGAKQPVAPSDRGILPTWQSMAYAVGAQDDYFFFYPGVSRYSHPNLSNALAYLEVDNTQVFSARDTPQSPLLTSAAIFAVETIVRLIRRVSPVLGNEPDVDADLEELAVEYNACVSVRAVPGTPPRKPL